MRVLRINLAWRVALLYAFFGGLWILFSDRLLLTLIADLHQLTEIQSYKGWGFVAVSATLIYILLRYELKQRAQVERLVEGQTNLLKDALKRISVEVAERKQSEEALRESEKKYRTLFETMTQGVVYQAADGRVVAANPAAERILGLTLDQMQGCTSADPRWRAIHEDGSAFPGETHPAMVALQSGQEVHNVMMGIFNPVRESYTWLNINAVPQFKPGERTPYQVYTTFEDITQRKLAEEARRESEERYRLISMITSDYMFSSRLEANGQLGLNWVAGAFEKITGYTFEEYLARGGWRATVYPDDLAVDDRDLAKLRTNQPVITEIRTLAKSGQVVWVRVYAHPVWDTTRQELVGIYGAVQDITERKRAEEALRESEERYRQLLELAPIGIAVYAEDKIAFTNLAGARLLGATSSTEIVGKPISEIVYPDRWQAAKERIGRMLAGEQGLYPTEDIYRRLDGSSVTVEVIASPLTYQGKSAVQVIVTDITERKQAEEQIQQQLGMLNALYTGARELATSLDTYELAEQITRACVEVFGARLAWLGHAEPDGSVRVLSHFPTDIEYPRHIIVRWDETPQGQGPTGRAIRGGMPIVFDDLTITPDFGIWRNAAQTEGFCTSAAFPLISGDRPFGALNLYSDQAGFFSVEYTDFFQTYAHQVAIALENAWLFEQVRANEEQLRNLTKYLQMAREEERTRIAREIHDEFGQALTALKIDLSWLTKRLPPEQPALLEKTKIMVDLLDATMQAVRRVATELRPGMLDDLGLLAAIEWQAQEFAERTGLECELNLGEESPPFARDLNTAIFRIFQETLTNVARHAEATRLWVEVENRPEAWILTVKDNGKGITHHQLVNPASLGLMGMRERARAWGGEVTLVGKSGQGTKVTVSMPRPKIQEGVT